MKHIKLFLFSILLIATSRLVFAVELKLHEGDNIERHREITDAAYKKHYASFDLKQLRAENLDEYAERVFSGVEKPFRENYSKVVLVDAIENDQIVGFALFLREHQSLQKDEFYLELIAVDPAFEGHGIGAKLTESIKIFEPQTHAILLQTRKLNIRAGDLYRRLGFVECSEAIEWEEGAEEFWGFKKVYQ